jgi:chemotaxis protein methyltransferase CheR
VTEPVPADGQGWSALGALAQAVGERYGLSLNACAPEGVERRLRYRMAERSLDRVEDYAEYLLYGGDVAAWDALVETLTVNEPHPLARVADWSPIKDLDSHPRWGTWIGGGPGPFRCLSAGCGTGEEVHSLAAALSDVAARTPSFDFEVIGVDLSERALRAARRGAGDSPRTRVRFARANLCAKGSLAPLGMFDLIVARGVLPVLLPEGRQAALANLVAALPPGGILLLGRDDSPAEVDADVAPIRWGDRCAYERLGSVKPPPHPDENRGPEPRTALVAHRSAVVRSWLRILLEHRGYRVDEAPDGLRALEHAVVERPRERYLIEWTLPVHGGPFVVERLGERAAAGVIFLSPREWEGSDPDRPQGARIVPLPLTELELDLALSPQSI